MVEVLVGTTIMALMLGLLMSALFSMTQSARAGEQRLDRIDSDRLLRAFIRRQIETAIPLTERSDDQEFVLFDGRPDRMRFVGHLPAHRGGGGLQFLELASRLSDLGETLVLDHRLAWPGIEFSAPITETAWQRQTLLMNLKTLRFAYYGAKTADAAPRWHDSWSRADRLPTLVKIAVEQQDGSWPELTVELRTPTATGQPHLFRLGEAG